MSPESVLNLEKQDELIASACCTVSVSLEKKWLHSGGGIHVHV